MRPTLNREVAHSAVERLAESNHSKVFTKLGIRSRRELANALPSSDAELVTA